MPFPPGVGGGRPSGDSSLSNYEVITADKAIDETNVGNRMLRSMGWQEGLVLSLPLLLEIVYTFLILICVSSLLLGNGLQFVDDNMSNMI